MGEFDFTYRLPQNFSRRVVQYLEQLESPNVARAFQNCTYDYEDLGLAYYAGMKGDNWDKKALDFTVEGSPRDIALLKSKGHILKESISKSLKSSESGFLLKEIYYFESESVEPIPLSNAARLNADIASSQVVLRDLLQIGQRFCLNCSFNGASSENSTNDYFRDLLFMKGYTEIKDQTRHGLSVNKKDSAEVDILLTKDGKEIAIYEGLKLSSVSTTYIDTHISKAVVNYNALGISTFIVAYVDVSDFDSFWNRYVSYLQSYSFPLLVKSPIEVYPYPDAAARVASTILSRDDYDFPVYFVAFKIPR